MQLSCIINIHVRSCNNGLRGTHRQTLLHQFKQTVTFYSDDDGYKNTGARPKGMNLRLTGLLNIQLPRKKDFHRRTDGTTNGRTDVAYENNR